MSTFIIGDIHGHSDAFSWAIKQCGVRDGKLPQGVSVCQAGDLTHGGPDSRGCLQIALDLAKENPRSYIQLLGNHELHYLGGPGLHAEVEELGDAERGLLERISRHSQLAWSSGDWLITHGGLTYGLWQELGSPQSAQQAAEALNQGPRERVLRPGWLYTGQVDLSCGISCPRTGSELAASWLDHHMPFSQVHGHEGVWWWPEDRFHSDTPDAVRRRSGVDRWRRRSWLHLDGGQLLSVDSKLGQDWASTGFSPFQLRDAPRASIVSADTLPFFEG